LKAVPATRRMPVRTQRIDLDGDFDGWWFECRVNVPAGTLLLLAGVTEGDAAALANLSCVLNFLAAIVVGWNFVDEDGADLPVGRAGCDRLPPELVQACMETFNRSATLPKA
ncbi:MAG TPA: hypothetical protein VFI15_12290, partial [Candidatus Limnocylindrales bacterium]|nr:hypothetical protein [Candidatus Limnocylindrales bacterium]